MSVLLTIKNIFFIKKNVPSIEIIIPLYRSDSYRYLIFIEYKMGDGVTNIGLRV